MKMRKGPVTTQLPDWEELFMEYLDQRKRLADLIRRSRNNGEDYAWLEEEMADLEQRLAAVTQMREVTASHQAA